MLASSFHAHRLGWVKTFQLFLRGSTKTLPTLITKSIVKMHRFMWAAELSCESKYLHL